MLDCRADDVCVAAQFQKIFILSMPNRSDKRDALSLSAYLTGLDIEFIDGVNGSLVSERAYPLVGALPLQNPTRFLL